LLRTATLHSLWWLPALFGAAKFKYSYDSDEKNQPTTLMMKTMIVTPLKATEQQSIFNTTFTPITKSDLVYVFPFFFS
jgi:hypothetical protein